MTSGAGSFGYGYRSSQPTLVSRVAQPYGHYETNAYDALGRLTGTALLTSGNAVMNDHAYTLNVGNQRITQARNGVGYANTVDYKYDALGQLLTAVGKEAGGTGRLQEQMGYAYDAGGNLKSRTNNALIQTFTVDSLNQLSTINRSGTLTVAGSTTSPATGVTVNSLAASLYTDTTFARAGFAPVDGTNTYTAIANDSYGRLDTNAISVWLPASATYSYDLNGNLTFDGRKAFEYDDENQLVRVTRTNEWKTEFVYDGKMRMRVKKEFAWSLGSGVWVLGSETRYIYDGMLVVQERDANNVAQVSYTRGRDLSGSFEGAGGIGGLLARSSIPEMLEPKSQTLLSTTFYHADGNGNITALMSTNGLIVAWYQYDAYGRTLAQTGPLAEANCYRFSSKAWHDKSGLYYYGYRFYTPELQRWVNRDPIGEDGGINLYGFVGNSPANEVDSFGLACEISNFKISASVRRDTWIVSGAAYTRSGDCRGLKLFWWTCTWGHEGHPWERIDNINHDFAKSGMVVVYAALEFKSCENGYWVRKTVISENKCHCYLKEYGRKKGWCDCSLKPVPGAPPHPVPETKPTGNR